MVKMQDEIGLRERREMGLVEIEKGSGAKGS